MNAHLDFELEVTAHPRRGYRIAVIHAPAGEGTTLARFPLAPERLAALLKDLRIALLRAGRTHRVLVTPEEELVQTLGQAFFDFLFGGEVGQLYRASQGMAAQQGRGLRLKLRLQAPELAALPWELLYDGRQGEHLALSTRTPLVRYLPVAHPPQPLQVQPPLQILAVVGHMPPGQDLDVDQERSRMETALAELRQRGLVALSWAQNQSWRELQRTLRQGPWHVVHFIGHGAFHQERDEGAVLLADDEGQGHWFTATQFGRLLADQSALRLVLLNACEGGRGSDQDVFASTGATLVRRGAPAVISMQHEISDRAALEFTRAFYEALADALPVDLAVTEARKAISLLAPDSVEWATPVLHMRSPEGRLFELVKAGHRRGLHRDPPPRSARAQIRVLSTQPSGARILATSPVRRANPGPETPLLELDWVAIPPGEFFMGSDPARDPKAKPEEQPPSSVYLPRFHMARTPVTNAQYKRFVDATHHRLPEHWINGAIPPGKEDHPVVYVSWYDAWAFCEWAGVRLPEEPEWEKAARGTDGRLYPWGNGLPDRSRCNFNGNEGDTTPVTNYPAGASPYGVLDMAGNVLEWTGSLFLPYPYQPRFEHQDRRSEEPRVARGGAYPRHPDLVWHVRCAGRFALEPGFRSPWVGFRVALG